MKSTSFAPANIRIINGEISEALKAVEEKHGIKINIGNVKYSDYQYQFKTEVLINDDATQNMVAQQELDRYRNRLGIKKHINIGFTFRLPKNDNVFTLKRVNPRASKLPILCDATDGKTYKMPPSYLEKAQPIRATV